MAKVREHLQRVMTEGAGVVRSAESLADATRAVGAVADLVGASAPTDRARGELANLATAAASLLSSATVRCETRGAHARSDYPDADPRWRRRIVHVGDRAALLQCEPLDGDPADAALAGGAPAGGDPAGGAGAEPSVPRR